MRYDATMEFCAWLFLIVIAAHYFVRRRYPSRKNTFFSLFLIIGLVDIAADIASAYVIEYAASLPPFVNIFVNYLLYVCQISLAPLFLLFILCVIGSLRKQYRLRVWLSMIPALLTLAALAVNPVYPLFFYFDQNQVYQHGTFFPLLFLGTGAYLLGAAVIIICNRKRIRSIEYFSMLAFIVILSASMLLQTVFPQYLLTGVALSLAICMMYLTMQNPEDMIDPASGVFDRGSFFSFTENLFLERRPFCVTQLHIRDLDQIERYLGVTNSDKLIGDIGAFLLEADMRATVFRIDDDRFCLVTRRRAEAERIESAVLSRFAESWRIANVELTVSVCGCFLPDPSGLGSAEALRSLFDMAFPLAKDNEPFLVIDSRLQETFRRTAKVEQLLRRSLDERTVEIALQPIYDLHDNRISGAEALARLRDTDGSVVMPGEFVPIAERTGLVVRLGEQVIDKACEFLSYSGLARNKAFTGLCVNLSVVECIDGSLVPKIHDASARCDIPPQKLCFEITESAATLADALPRKMETLRSEGYYFALDDFGSGYSNYDSLMRLPFCAVKLDRMMLALSMTSKRSETVLVSMVEMAQKLGMDTVVEGVENAAQEALLRRHGIRFAQGYHFFRPMTPQAFVEAFERANARKTSLQIS